VSLHGIDLVAYAIISADLAEGDRPVADVLEERKISLDAWTEVTTHWAKAMAADAATGTPALVLEFSDHFAKAQDAKKPLPPLDIRSWALLKRDVDHLGPHKALAARGLALADYSRLVRHWAKAIATNRDLAAAFEEASEGV
jgi:hypothetical protein